MSDWAAVMAHRVGVANSLALLMLVSCHKQSPPSPAQPKATLVGLAEKRHEGNKRFQLEGKIVAIDGRKAKLRPGKSIKLDGGCHTVEAWVNYKLVNAMDGPCLGYVISRELCNTHVTSFKSGRRRFAILMQPGKRYELSVHLDANAASVYFVEVDTELGTTAKFLPVPPGTKSCAAPTPVDHLDPSSSHASGSSEVLPPRSSVQPEELADSRERSEQRDVRPLSGAESHGTATQHEAQYAMGVGYGWGRREHINPMRWGVFLHAGYTATSGVYVGLIGDAYSGESIERADGRTDIAMGGLGIEVGYDLRLAERWTVRFALLNAAGVLMTTQCRQLQPPPSMVSCSDAEPSWLYAIGPSAQALYLWEKALFFAELRHTSYLSSSAATFGGTAVIGFGFHF